MTVRHQFLLILIEIGVGQKKKKKKKKKPDFWCGNEEGTDQNCERSSFSPQHSHQNIGLLKRGLLILIGLSLRLHSYTSSTAISGFGAGGDVRGASNAGLHSRRTWPSSALSLPTCAFTSEKDWQFASSVPKILFGHNQMDDSTLARQSPPN